MRVIEIKSMPCKMFGDSLRFVYDEKTNSLRIDWNKNDQDIRGIDIALDSYEYESWKSFIDDLQSVQ